MGEMRTEVEADLAADGIAPEHRTVTFEADLRFTRQVWEIQVPLPDGPVDGHVIDGVLEAFREEYAKRYGQGSIVLGAPIELVAVRAVGLGHTVRAELAVGAAEPVAAGTPAPVVGRRAVRLDRGDSGSGGSGTGTTDVAVYDGPQLQPGHTLAGPALVDGTDTTIWIPAGATAQVDAHGTLIVETTA
jgi:N-methylhydantoinase A